MLRLRGKPLGGQVSLGSATVLRAPNGIPMLPARLVAQMARARHDEPIEPVEVVLVVRDYESASSMALPWARVVGIVAEHAADDALFGGVPTVTGIEGALEKVDDDALVLIDGERGIVLVDPDGHALAAYQAERERIAPRRRIFLDYSHQPAVSLDGREIRVIGLIKSLDDVRRALDSGADSLFVRSDSLLLSPEADDESHLDSLLNLAEAAAGKPITIDWDVKSVTAANILQAARRAELTVCVPLSAGAGGFAEIQNYLQDTREELLAEDIDFADVRLAGTLSVGEELPPEAGDLFISRIVVSSPAPPAIDAETGRWLDSLAVQATRFLLPIEVNAQSAPIEVVQAVLAFGAAGVMVEPAQVGAVKDMARSTNLASLRGALAEAARPTPSAARDSAS